MRNFWYLLLDDWDVLVYWVRHRLPRKLRLTFLVAVILAAIVVFGGNHSGAVANGDESPNSSQLQSHLGHFVGFSPAQQELAGTLLQAGAPTSPSERLELLLKATAELDAQNWPYSYGGGHTNDYSPSLAWAGYPNLVTGRREVGYDCSSSVTWALHKSGYDFSNPGYMTADDYARWWGDPGVGKHVTIYANDHHVFMVINGRGWGTSHQNYKYGAGFFSYSSSMYQGFTARHPPGL